MLFNSAPYAIFFPIVFGLYWIVPQRIKWIILLISSYYFYMSWNPKYVLLILGTTIVTYFAGLLLEDRDNKWQKRLVLWTTAFLCLGILFVFKYFNFAISSVCAVFEAFSIHLSPVTLNLILPVGISFYTFQTLSYVIDVSRGGKAEHHFGYYATFISFFPQLVAGPIERTSNLLPQIKSNKQFNESQSIDGIKIMAWGYYKKMVVADYLCTYVDRVYNDVHAYTGFSLLIVMLLFSIQIYCDFSGYSSIAQGSAKLLGIELMDNFKSPYFSASVKEFWKRWHISLSTWFRDYVYIPLGGNRCGKIRRYVNLLLTFFISGLWHGASWTFVFWGLLHGLAQCVEILLDGPINRIKNVRFFRYLSVVIVFIFCNIAWVFFRAKTFSDAWYILNHCADGLASPVQYFREGLVSIGFAPICYMLVFISILGLVDSLNKDGQLIGKIKNHGRLFRWISYLALAIMVIIFAQKGMPAAFVYFQF